MRQHAGAAANPADALLLQSMRPVGRVAEPGSSADTTASLTYDRPRRQGGCSRESTNSAITMVI